MRLRPAHSLEEYDQDERSEFGDREERRERREARRERRRRRRHERRYQRQERHAERRLRRVGRKKDRVRRKLGQPAQARRRAEPTLQPASTARPQPLLDKAVEWLDELVDEEPLEEEEDDEDDATEGFGASPFRRRAEAWGPAVRMGRRLRIQAAAGHRAAVIDLKPGLFLVAEIPEVAARTEFGIAPLLAPLMLTAARRSMDEPDQERRGPFARLFRRRRREEPVRYVPVAQPAPQAAPLALPGPTEGGAMVVAAPNVGWADDATVAAAIGCEACEPRRRR